MIENHSQDIKIIFFGTPEFGAIILEQLIQSNLKPLLVVTAPDKPVGRKQVLTPSAVKVIAQKYEIPIAQTEKIQDTIYKIQDIKPDLVVLAAYGRIIPKEILDIPAHGALNVHPSLLPKYRGASPVQTAILNGEEETGVTIILMDEQIDHGPIVASSKFKVQSSKVTYPQLHNQLAELGAKLLIETIPLWIEGKIKPVPQDHSKATFTKHIKKEDGRIDWGKSAEYIERQVRAFDPWPGTYTKFEIRNSKSETNSKFKILKILQVEILQDGEKRKPGETFVTPDGKLAVQTGKDALLIEELQLEGGRPMSSRDFLLGHRDFFVHS